MAKINPAQPRKGQPPKAEPRDTALSIRVKRSLYDAMKHGADEDNRSVASFAELILIEGLKARGLLK